MIQIEFTEEAIEKLRYERFHHPHPRVQRTRMYYADFASFSAAITDCLARTHTDHKAALDSLLTLRFQTLEEPRNVAA